MHVEWTDRHLFTHCPGNFQGSKGKSKSVPVNAMKVQGGVEEELYTFLTSH